MNLGDALTAPVSGCHRFKAFTEDEHRQTGGIAADVAYSELISEPITVS